MAFSQCRTCAYLVSDAAAACPRCGHPVPKAAAGVSSITIGLFAAGLATAIVFAFTVKLGSSGTTSAPPTPPPQTQATKPLPTMTPLDRVMVAPSMRAAFLIAQPYMTDEPNKVSDGTQLLAAWAAANMRWSDVLVATDETSPALAKKDTDEARGKRMCFSGTIIQIAKSAPGVQLYEGLFNMYAGGILAFMAAGSSGSLVERSESRLCGVVTGLYDYANSGGGISHAVQIVGMFDLPQNKPAKPVPAAAP